MATLIVGLVCIVIGFLAGITVSAMLTAGDDDAELYP